MVCFGCPLYPNGPVHPFVCYSRESCRVHSATSDSTAWPRVLWTWLTHLASAAASSVHRPRGRVGSDAVLWCVTRSFSTGVELGYLICPCDKVGSVLLVFCL